MSIANELTDLQANLKKAKAAVVTKGGTVGETGLNGLEEEILSIPSGSPTPPSPEPLDPQVVYEQTRPKYWMKMPEAKENEVYLLLDISNNTELQR